MKIGIMADTHDNQEAVEEAVDFFNSREIEQVLHAGDLVSPFTATKFEDLDGTLHFVWGNNEGARHHIRLNMQDIGANIYGEFASLEFDECKIAMLHGENEKIVEALAGSDSYDVVVRGHTHNPGMENGGKVVNPGPASGYLSNSRTVAVLDTEDSKVEIIRI